MTAQVSRLTSLALKLARLNLNRDVSLKIIHYFMQQYTTAYKEAANSRKEPFSTDPEPLGGSDPFLSVETSDPP